MKEMRDSLIPNNIPISFDLASNRVATYVDHPEIQPSPMTQLARFKHASHVSISAHSVPGNIHHANVLDLENGAATLDALLPFIGAMRAVGGSPALYATQSNIALGHQLCWSRRIAEPLYWLADWDGVALLPDGYIAKQYTANLPGNPYDTSVTANYWPGVDPHPATPPVIRKEHDMARIIVSIHESTKTLNYGEWELTADGGAHWIRDQISAAVMVGAKDGYGQPLFENIGSISWAELCGRLHDTRINPGTIVLPPGATLL